MGLPNGNPEMAPGGPAADARGLTPFTIAIERRLAVAADKSLPTVHLVSGVTNACHRLTKRCTAARSHPQSTAFVGTAVMHLRKSALVDEPEDAVRILETTRPSCAASWARAKDDAASLRCRLGTIASGIKARLQKVGQLLPEKK